jgi:hypothetical protein
LSSVTQLRSDAEALAVHLGEAEGRFKLLNHEMREALMLYQQVITTMRRAGLGDTQREWLDNIGQAILFTQGMAQIASGDVISGGFTMIGLMQTLSEHATLRSLMSSTILDADVEARMRR